VKAGESRETKRLVVAYFVTSGLSAVSKRVRRFQYLLANNHDTTKVLQK